MTMPIAPSPLGQAALGPLLLAVFALAAALFSAAGWQLRKLRQTVAGQQRRIEELEARMGASTQPSFRQPSDAVGPAADSRYKVLYLHNLSRSSQQIAEEAGMRAAEVDFILRVNQQAGLAGLQ